MTTPTTTSIWRTALDLRRAEREGPIGLARRQGSRLQALITHARAHSRYYKRLYCDLPEAGIGLPQLPVVNKHHLMAAFDDWVTDPEALRACVDDFIKDPSRIGTPFLGRHFVSTSAGTTGTPGIFIQDPGAITVLRAIQLARITPAWFDAGQLFRMAGRHFRWASVLGTGGHYAGAGWLEMERRRGGWRAQGIKVFSVQCATAELVDELNTFDPALLTGYPSTLDILADEQIERRLHLHPVMVETGGESMTARTRARISAAFGCPLRELYSASECQFMAFSCGEGWLHLNTDWAILEPVNQDLSPTPPGEASHSVLLTHLANRIQPIIRYDLGDSIRFRPDRCPCGSSLPAIRVAGRCDDVLTLRTSEGQVVTIAPLAIGEVIDETQGVTRGQLLQVSPTCLRLRLSIDSARDGEQTWQRAISRLKRYLLLQGLPAVEVIRADEPPWQQAPFGKFRQVLGNVQPDPLQA